MTYVAAADRYEQIPYVRVGRSGLRLPPVSLGLWHNFGDERPFETQRAIVRRAFDLGVTHFDLANNYGPPAGSAETNFGRLLATDLAPYRDELIVSTKAGYRMWDGPYGEWGSRKYLLSSLDQSLRRLSLDYVDVYYSHRPDPDTPVEETMGALAHAVRQGKALYVGISNYSPDETRRAAAALAAEGVPLTIHQPRYSMFDRRIEDGLFEALDEVGAASIVFSPLAQGLLTDRYLGGDVPAGSRAATSHFLPPERISAEYLERARALDAIAKGRGQTLAQLAVTWVLRQPLVASALIGASSVAQLEQNVAALEASPLTADEIAAIEPFAAHGTVLG
ncbi:aldo/keto reductase [Agromyces protaetiae]|uniref:Aldo/keto reductase n=1 Tax=Agromyces protaetiae TaxID=2509455 RepID=A0A4P6FTF4_9MICO|nr:aldo/keto reductase [Agromyces protaetiae]QAY73838.1 aldo/keto reductase [Agromyces protaetiae]